MTKTKRLRDMTWDERGEHAYGQGEPREPGPYPVGTPEGEDWRAGWDRTEAAALEGGGDASPLQVMPVKLRLERGRFQLVDSAGRVLGTQAYINVEQAEQGQNVTVTFAGVEIEAAL